MTAVGTYDMRCPFCGSETVGGSCPSCGRDLQVLEGIRSTRDWAHVDGTIGVNKAEGDVHSFGLFIPKGQRGGFMKSMTVLTVVALLMLTISVIAFISFILLLLLDAGASAAAGVLAALLVLPVLMGGAAVYILWKHRGDWARQREEAERFSH